MAYSNINLQPTARVPGEKLPRTGWRRPELDWKAIWEWYDNFHDWQNILPKTGHSRDPSSVWYTHEWSPGIPVIPNMSRPPLYFRRGRKSFMYDASFEYNSSRSLNNSSDSDWGEVSSAQDVYRDVWYKRITYMIKTVIVTITTTVLSVVKKEENHPHTNGFRPTELSFTDSEEDTFNSQTKQDYWFIKVFKYLFSTLASVFVYCCRAIVMPFYMLFSYAMMVQTYIMTVFHSMFRMNRSKRLWALILLLVVPYLIIFGFYIADSCSFPSIGTVANLSNPFDWLSLEFAPVNL